MKKGSIFCFLLCIYSFLLTKQEEMRNNIEPEKTYYCHNCHHCHPAQEMQKDEEQKQNEKEIQGLAIATLANMAQGILNIGWDPHNSVNVTNNITTILGNFINLIMHCMRNKSIDVNLLLNDEEFITACKQLLINEAEIIKKKYQEISSPAE